MKKAVLIIVFLFVGLFGFCQNVRHYIIRYQTQGEVIYHNTQSVSSIHIDTLGQELIHSDGMEWSLLSDLDTVYIYRLTLITQPVTNITQTTATCGGIVTATDYVDVTERGICWNTDGMPTLADNHVSDGSGIGSFNCNMTGLSANTTYHVRAYVQLGNEYIYGNETSFITEPLPSYTVTVSSNPPEGGMVTGGGTYEQGQSCMLQAIANTGYIFLNWTENGNVVSNNPTYSFTVTTDASFVANFVQDSYTITATANPPEGGSVNGVGTYNYGETATLSATANEGFVFNKWTKNGIQVSTNPTYSFSVTESASYVAVFSINGFEILAVPNPTDGGTITGIGIYNNGESCTLTALANEFYTFVNWTENGTQVSTSANYTFTVTNNRTLVAHFVSSNDDHAYVDLGLPSGLLWATCNIGADAPEDYGEYFAWGETTPKSVYNWGTYQIYDGSNVTRYTGSDGLTTLLPEDDAAVANWGGGWRMPTIEEWQELVQNTTVTWDTINDVNGRLFTASNGNSLFIPAAGYYYASTLELSENYGLYWSSSLYMINTDGARNFYFNSEGYLLFNFGRCVGQSVRPVRSAP